MSTKRWLRGTAALGLTAAVGTALLAGPAGAQEEVPEEELVELQATLSPEAVAPGGEVTVTSGDPCTVGEGAPGELYWYTLSSADFSDVGEGTAPLAEDGSWEVTFAAPDTPGDYEFWGVCLPGDLLPEEEAEAEELLAEGPEALTTMGDDGGHEGEGDHGEEPLVIEYYGPLPFAVQDEGGPAPEPTPEPTPAPPAAAPAQPVVREPSYTG